MSDKYNKGMRLYFHYSVENGCHLQIAHGVWGGINPHGEIEMNFYHESDALPKMTEHIVSSDGSIEDEFMQDENGRHINRVVHSRILLNHETARALAEWLQGQLDLIEDENFDNDAISPSPEIAQ